MLMRHSLILISIVFILFSCDSTDNTKQSATSMSPTIDSAKLARQKEKEKYLADQATTLNLLPINKGVDSFELRLWVGSMFVEHDLIILTYKNEVWDSHKIRYYKNEDGVTHFKEEKIKTNFSVTNLADSLKLVDFATFISQDEIKD